MRYLLPCCLVLALVAAGCHNDDKKAEAAAAAVLADTAHYTTIRWLDSTKDFGKIKEGQKLPVSFRFRNTGDKPLVITRVQPSCGCTVAEQPDKPILPGGEGLIRASFDSEGRVGINHKTLFITANTKGSSRFALTFVVEVEKISS